MNLEAVLGAYGLMPTGGAEPLRQGTAARVWRAETDGGSVVVRTLPNAAQGALEWAIFRHLAEHGFPYTPAVLTALSGAPAAEEGGTWYQLQRFCGGRSPDPARPGTVRRAAALAAALERALADCPAELPGEGQVIHGDLGPWNLVETEAGALWVLDFGSARRGDPYFDLAALLAGFVNHARAEDRPRVLAEFLAGAGPVDRGRLLAQTRLWAAEGTEQWSRRPAGEDMVEKFAFALRWAEEHLEGRT